VRVLVPMYLRNWYKDGRLGSGSEFCFLARTRRLCSIRAMLEGVRFHPNRIVAGAPISTNTVARGSNMAMSVTRPDLSFRSCCREDESKSNGPGDQCGSPPLDKEGSRLGRGSSGIRTSAPLSGAINAVEFSARRSCHIIATVYCVITRPPSVLSVVMACSDGHDVKSNPAAYALSNSEQRS
jgi:hypothetical protein